jgi:Helix-loop-helix DNA-binding domain
MLYSQSTLLPTNPHGLPMSGGSGSSFHIDSHRRTPIRSEADRGPHAFGSVTGPGTYDKQVQQDSSWIWLAQPPTSHLHNLDQSNLHGALSSPTRNHLTPDSNALKHTNGKTGKVHGQHNALQANLDTCDFTPYKSSLEEPNEVNDSMLDDGAFSAGVPYICPPHPHHPAEATETQSLLFVSNDSTTTGMKDEEKSPWQPLSHTEQVPSPPLTPITPQAMPAVKKISDKCRNAHSAVEKRYRTNLNSKIEQLQQCMPNTLLEIKAEEESGQLNPGEGHGKKGGKLQKSLILSNAATYIRALQSNASQIGAHNKLLEGQNELLQRRLDMLQRIALQKTGTASNPACQIEGAVQALRITLVDPGVESQSVGSAKRMPRAIAVREFLEGQTEKSAREDGTNNSGHSSKHEKPSARAKRRKCS